ncbi:MAG: AgmX/PglI C-terminal domain-containing protein [Bdellovibrionales bacterium]|nr:AgmX/PglI C-terminal domain-containing protein [Bdellovibrionales bacterium]
MRGLKGLGPLVLVGIVGLLWLLFLSEPGSNWLTSLVVRDSIPGPVVGRLMRLDGQLKRIHEGDVQEIKGPLGQPLDLNDGDRLETNDKSHALLILNSQDELELEALSSVSLQLWNAKDANSALYLNVLSGDITLVKPGVRGRAYVVREGRLYLPGQKATKKPMALTVLRSAPLDMQLAQNSKESTPTEDLEGEDAPPPDAGGLEPETLSNEYIDEMIVSRQSQFQKCWLSRLKDRPGLKGQMVVQFEISRRGKVREVKIADSAVDDEALQKCVITVFERLYFRTFKGSEISLSYPLNFE